MSRDFHKELRDDKCWDRATQAVFEKRGEPVEDCILQTRDELIGLCELIERNQIHSYLEIGVWTGRLATTLHRVFNFEKLAACDDGYARRFGLPISLPEAALYFEGDSTSDEYLAWRRGLGAFDLVMIDANHLYAGVLRDYEINRKQPHRFLAFHDIAGSNPETRGVRRFWRELKTGFKAEIVRPHVELGLDVSTMGIGIWSASERAICPDENG